MRTRIITMYQHVKDRANRARPQAAWLVQERKVKVHFQTLLRRSRFSKRSFKEHLQILKHFQVCKCKSRDNKKVTVQITLHRKLQSKLRYLHRKLHHSKRFQKTFCYHFLT